MVKKLRILVVEDREENINVARTMLAEHDVTVVTGYDQARKQMTYSIDYDIVHKLLEEQGLPRDRNAYEKAYGTRYWDDEGKQKEKWKKAEEKAEENSKPKPFDVVLTDVMLPKGGYACMSSEGKAVVNAQGEMPYGAYIFLYAIETGTKLVGMITSGNHHDDPFIYALDNMYGFQAGDIKTVITNQEDVYIKADDWTTIVNDIDDKRDDDTRIGIEWVEWKEMKEMMDDGRIVLVKNWAKLLNDLLKL